MRFVHPMDYAGTYRTASWPGYVFKEALGYTSGRHTGTDYNGAGSGNADLGMEARSISDGVVEFSGDYTKAGYGNTLIIRHDLVPELQKELGTTHLYSRYMHLNTREVAVGQRLKAGQRIGTVGNTGTQYAHLHLDIWKANLGVHLDYHKDSELQSYVDPFEFIENHKHDIGGVEMIKGRAAAIKAYFMLRGSRPVSEAEINETADRRSYEEFIATGQAEATVHDN